MPSTSSACFRRLAALFFLEPEGVRIIPLEVLDCDVDALVEYGLVDERHIGDRAEIAQGIQLLLFALSQNVIEIDADRLESLA